MIGNLLVGYEDGDGNDIEYDDHSRPTMAHLHLLCSPGSKGPNILLKCNAIITVWIGNRCEINTSRAAAAKQHQQQSSTPAAVEQQQSQHQQQQQQWAAQEQQQRQQGQQQSSSSSRQGGTLKAEISLARWLRLCCWKCEDQLITRWHSHRTF